MMNTHLIRELFPSFNFREGVHHCHKLLMTESCLPDAAGVITLKCDYTQRCHRDFSPFPPANWGPHTLKQGDCPPFVQILHQKVGYITSLLFVDAWNFFFIPHTPETESRRTVCVTVSTFLRIIVHLLQCNRLWSFSIINNILCNGKIAWLLKFLHGTTDVNKELNKDLKYMNIWRENG